MNYHILRNGRMRSSIEELEKKEHASGLTPSPRKARSRRLIGEYVDRTRSIVLMIVLILVSQFLGMSWMFHNYLSVDDLIPGIKDLLFLAAAFYFAWTGWFKARWEYRWYPAFALGVLAAYAGVNYLVELAAASGAGS